LDTGEITWYRLAKSTAGTNHVGGTTIQGEARLLDFRLQDIFAYEDDYTQSGERVAIRVTLKDGSQRICQGDDLTEFLALVEHLRTNI